MLAIKNNIMAANAARYLGRSYDALATSVERLSSGLRINSAADDAAGMAVRELMRADIAVLEQGTRNTLDGVSMLQTMEGAMATIDNCLVRMKQLAEQASTGSYSSAQRIIMNNEFTEMAAEIERISKTTKFNDISMLDNSTERSIRFGTATDDAITVSGADMTKAGLGIVTGTAGYEAVSDHGVDVSSDAWLTLTDATNGNETQTLSITFQNEAAVSVSFAGVTADNVKTYTLDQVVQAINAVSLNLPVAGDGTVQAYEMASVYHNDADGKDYLKLVSRTTTAASLAMTLDTSTNTAATTGWQVIANQGATSLLEDPLVAGDQGLMNVAAGTGINLLTADAAVDALDAVGTAIGLKDTARAAFGYKINRLESTGEVLAIQMENLMAAESRISDVDVATEMAQLTRNQVLAQAGTAMLGQANSIPQMALSLLR